MGTHNDNGRRGRAWEPVWKAACAYHAERGWAVTPVKGKVAFLEGWQEVRIDPASEPKRFAGATGCALVLGLSGLADLEADCLAAALVLEALAPETRCIWQHGGRKHRLYRSQAQHREFAFRRSTLVEVRAGAHQSVAPPSIHPETQQPYTWVEDGDPAEVPAQTLYRAATLAAVAGACAKCWPTAAERGRHHAALALAGTLRRAGVSREEALVVVHAICAATGDEEPANRLAAVEATYARQEGEETTGLPSLATLLGKQLADFLAQHLLKATQEDRLFSLFPFPPYPHGDVEWPAAMAEEAYHGFVGEFVRYVEPRTEADPVALVLNLLVWAGNLIGPGAYAKVGPDIHRLNENVVLVGPTSSGRKGTSAGPARELFREVEPDWVSRRLHGLSSGEGLIWAIRDPIAKTVPIKEKGRITGYQEQIEDPGVDDKRLLVLEAEFANILKVMVREGNTLSVQVRQAWDQDLIRSVTKNNPAVATGAHVSIIGHITPEELRKYLTETEAVNGFGNRFLWACVRRARLLPEGGEPMDFTELGSELRRIVETARGLGELKRDEAARHVWAAIYPDLTADQPGMFGAVTSRGAAHVLRLSALYAALDGAPLIRVEHLFAALAVWDYCVDSARYLFGEATGDVVADFVLAALHRSPAGLSRTAIGELFSQNARSGRIDQALERLQRANRVRLEKEKTGGRSREVWHAEMGETVCRGSLLQKARAAFAAFPGVTEQTGKAGKGEPPRIYEEVL